MKKFKILIISLSICLSFVSFNINNDIAKNDNILENENLNNDITDTYGHKDGNI